jgi:hypothetical protein
MINRLLGLALCALACSAERPGATEAVGTLAQRFSRVQKPLSSDVITNLDRLDPTPQRRWTSGGPFVANPLSCHHVQSAAKYEGHYYVPHSMPEQGILAVVDPNGVVHNVPLPGGNGGPTLAHPGGIQVMGDILAVGLSDAFRGALVPEDCGKTVLNPRPDVVRFYDLTEPLMPVPDALPDLTTTPFLKPYAVALTRVGATTVLVVVTGDRTLRFFTLPDHATSWVEAGPTWTAVEEGTGDQQKDCALRDMKWCRPDSINLYREPNGTMKLLTFSRGTSNENTPGDRERIGVYTLSLTPTPSVSHVKTYLFSPAGSTGNMRYGGGSEVTDDGTLLAFAFPRHFCNDCGTPFVRYGGWSPASEYDYGFNPAVAASNGVAVQIHEGPSRDKLFYRVGQINQSTRRVSWGTSTQFALGVEPAVAVDGNGNVVVLHTVYAQQTPDIHACVGSVNVTARSITWHRCEVTDTGTDPTLAMDEQLGVVEVHNGSREDNRRTLYARVGRLDLASDRVLFGQSRSFDTGLDSSVTVDRFGTVVEAHNGSVSATERNLYFAVGRANFDTKTMTWGSSSKKGTGSQLSVGLDDSSRFVELHQGSSASTAERIYFSFGNPDPLTKTISWKGDIGGFRDAGTHVAMAVTDAGMLLETHNAPSPLGSDALWYSLADVSRLP